MAEGKGSRDREGVPREPHEEFLELCALATSGNLSESELAKLKEHLAACPECRAAFQEFESIANKLSSELAPDTEQDSPADSSFSQEEAEASFQKRLEEERQKERDKAAGERDSLRATPRDRKGVAGFGRYEIWLPLAASILLCTTFGILSYRTGRMRGIEWARLEEGSRQTQIASNAAPAVIGIAPVDEQLASRDAALTELRREAAQKTAELTKLKALQAEQEARFGTSSRDQNQLAEEKKKLAEERDRLVLQVSEEETALKGTQERLRKLERERSDYVLHTASLETKINELSNLLDERERQTSEQQDLLAKDRDIRDLIGARDLYITEIYDVAHSGDTRKAAGRVFYTKGKSLIFYAYDLKENPGGTDAGMFEAWGQRGSDWRQASKLGIFYEDNTGKKRWVVKSNDRKTLEQLDAVFVTFEPNGGSERPTGKPMLFAYLKVTPNHP
jgi:anti-sigma factor RsiW